MSRYTGPRIRIVRRLGADLPGLTRKSAERKPYPPGQHGQGRRGKISLYGQQMREKQKLRFNYGLTEKQMRKVVKEAFRRRGAPAENILKQLEGRLDNTVFRCGFAPTIPAARQLVSHGHIRINGKKCDIPSAQVKAGMELTISIKGDKIPAVTESWENPSLTRPTWLEISESSKVAKVAKLPEQEDCPLILEMPLVVEYYSRFVK